MLSFLTCNQKEMRSPPISSHFNINMATLTLMEGLASPSPPTSPYTHRDSLIDSVRTLQIIYTSRASSGKFLSLVNLSIKRIRERERERERERGGGKEEKQQSLLLGNLTEGESW